MSTLPDIKTILYATDLGENTRPVFRSALSLAKKFNSKIIMLHVVEPMSSTIQAVVETYLTEIDAKKIHKDGMREVLVTMRKRLEAFCKEELDSQNLKNMQVKEMLIVSGKTSEEIIKAAEKNGVDLIVIGKSTGNIFGSDVAGSTARRVSRYADIPVFIVPNN